MPMPEEEWRREAETLEPGDLVEVGSTAYIATVLKHGVDTAGMPTISIKYHEGGEETEIGMESLIKKHTQRPRRRGRAQAADATPRHEQQETDTNSAMVRRNQRRNPRRTQPARRDEAVDPPPLQDEKEPEPDQEEEFTDDEFNECLCDPSGDPKESLLFYLMGEPQFQTLVGFQLLVPNAWNDGNLIVPDLTAVLWAGTLAHLEFVGVPTEEQRELFKATLNLAATRIHNVPPIQNDVLGNTHTKAVMMCMWNKQLDSFHPQHKKKVLKKVLHHLRSLEVDEVMVETRHEVWDVIMEVFENTNEGQALKALKTADEQRRRTIRLQEEQEGPAPRPPPALAQARDSTADTKSIRTDFFSTSILVSAPNMFANGGGMRPMIFADGFAFLLHLKSLDLAMGDVYNELHELVVGRLWNLGFPFYAYQDIPRRADWTLWKRVQAFLKLASRHIFDLAGYRDRELNIADAKSTIRLSFEKSLTKDDRFPRHLIAGILRVIDDMNDKINEISIWRVDLRIPNLPLVWKRLKERVSTEATQELEAWKRRATATSDARSQLVLRTWNNRHRQQDVRAFFRQHQSFELQSFLNDQADNANQDHDSEDGSGDEAAEDARKFKDLFQPGGDGLSRLIEHPCHKKVVEFQYLVRAGKVGNDGRIRRLLMGELCVPVLCKDILAPHSTTKESLLSATATLMAHRIYDIPHRKSHPAGTQTKYKAMMECMLKNQLEPFDPQHKDQALAHLRSLEGGCFKVELLDKVWEKVLEVEEPCRQALQDWKAADQQIHEQRKTSFCNHWDDHNGDCRFYYWDSTCDWAESLANTHTLVDKFFENGNQGQGKVQEIFGLDVNCRMRKVHLLSLMLTTFRPGQIRTYLWPVLRRAWNALYPGYPIFQKADPIKCIKTERWDVQEVAKKWTFLNKTCLSLLFAANRIYDICIDPIKDSGKDSVLENYDLLEDTEVRIVLRGMVGNLLPNSLPEGWSLDGDENIDLQAVTQALLDAFDRHPERFTIIAIKGDKAIVWDELIEEEAIAPHKGFLQKWKAYSEQQDKKLVKAIRKQWLKQWDKEEDPENATQSDRLRNIDKSPKAAKARNFVEYLLDNNNNEDNPQPQLQDGQNDENNNNEDNDGGQDLFRDEDDTETGNDEAQQAAARVQQEAQAAARAEQEAQAIARELTPETVQVPVPQAVDLGYPLLAFDPPAALPIDVFAAVFTVLDEQPVVSDDQADDDEAPLVLALVPYQSRAIIPYQQPPILTVDELRDILFRPIPVPLAATIPDNTVPDTLPDDCLAMVPYVAEEDVPAGGNGSSEVEQPVVSYDLAEEEFRRRRRARELEYARILRAQMRRRYGIDSPL